MIASDAHRDASFRSRLSLFVHLAMCRYCRAYARSLRLIGETARRFYASTPAEGERLVATLSAVQEAIHQAPAE
jgi:hypothetical protein